MLEQAIIMRWYLVGVKQVVSLFSNLLTIT